VEKTILFVNSVTQFLPKPVNRTIKTKKLQKIRKHSIFRNEPFREILVNDQKIVSKILNLMDMTHLFFTYVQVLL
jgi:hypothetical protein